MRVTFMTDEEAVLVSLEGEQVVIRSSLASAPGSRPTVILPNGTRLRAKIHRCRRIDDKFQLSGRMLDMSRPVRERLVADVAEHDTPASS